MYLLMPAVDGVAQGTCTACVDGPVNHDGTLRIVCCLADGEACRSHAQQVLTEEAAQGLAVQYVAAHAYMFMEAAQ